MIYGTKDSAVMLSATLIERDEDLYPQVTVRSSASVSQGTFSLEYVAEGIYHSTSWTPTVSGYYTASVIVYTDAAHTSESTLYGTSGAVIKVDEVETKVGNIETDTNELQVDWVNGGRLDLIVDELTTQGDTNESKLDIITTDTNELQTDWTNAGRLDAILDELTSQGDTNEGKIDTLDTVADTILLDTNELQTDWKNGGRLDTILDATAIEANVETHVTNSLNTYDPPTRGELTTDKNSIITEVDANETKIDALNDISTGDVNTQCTNALNTYDPPTRTELTTDKDSIITEVDANETKIDTAITDIGALNDVSTSDIQTYCDAAITANTMLVDMNSSVTFINDIEGGRWHRVGTQMKFYKADNVTLVATFDLKASDGTAAGETDDVYRRNRA